MEAEQNEKEHADKDLPHIHANKKITKQRTFLIFELSLLELVCYCIKCGSPVTQPILVADIEKLTKHLWEVFHSVKVRYLPKSSFFQMEKMIAGTQLAALDHNHNINRDQVRTFYIYSWTASADKNLF